MRIDYGNGVAVDAAEGCSVLEASQDAAIDHAHACGGRGLCTTCRVRVEAGHEHCPAPEHAEAQALGMNGLEPPIRLGCQLRPTGPIAVRILIPEHSAPSRITRSAVEEQVAVLFSDLRGFTSFAERHLPFDVANVLNRYFDTMGVIVERHGGHILDYLGDGLMILFRPGDPDPSCRAVRCALEMLEKSRSFGSYVQNHFSAELRLGAAVDAGRAVVGRLGYFRDRHLNAVGDVLNRVARLEDLNKDLDTNILITQPVADDCGQSAALGRSFALRVRGRQTPLTAWEVLGPGSGAA